MISPDLPRNTILVGDVRQQLRTLPDCSVDTVITSPPYVQMRNYQVDGQIGLEDDVAAWVAALRQVGRELSRVLKPTGSWWLNLGDSYAYGRDTRTATPPKSLRLGPERLVLALVEDGWIVRNKVVFAKTNGMPASVRDRLTNKWEVVYFLVRSPIYSFDLDAIRVRHRSPPAPTRRLPEAHPGGPLPSAKPPSWGGPHAGNNSGLTSLKARGLVGHPLGANPGDVWSMATASFRGEHFATFPPALVERPLLATCPEKVCARCGASWARQTIRVVGHLAVRGELLRTCECRAGVRPGIVLDCFFGAGTVGLVAERYGRDWLGIELNPAFATLARKRIASARNERSRAA